MSQPVVDTLQISDALRKTGMEREQAEGLARALGDELGAHVVVQGDLQTGFLEVRGEIQSVDHKVDLARTELVGEIQVLDGKIDGVRTELGGQIQVLDGKIDRVRTDLGGRIDALDGKIAQVKTELDAKIDQGTTELGGRIAALESKLTFMIAGMGLFIAAVALAGRMGIF